MKNLLIISLFYCAFISYKAQIKTDTMREKLDIELLKKEAQQYPTSKTYKLRKDLGNGAYYKISGNLIIGFTKNEQPPLPHFYKIYKEFYPDGYLKKKIIFLGESTKVGTSQYYDEQGRLKEVNEDAKFGKIKPRDVLNFLEQKGYINQQTGEGRDGFNLSFLEKDGRNIWYIVVWEGRLRESPPKSWQYQSAYEPFIYEMDAETGGGRQVSEAEFLGEIDQIPKDPNPSSSIYKTYKGRNYTEKEWKDFVEKDVQAYLQRKNRSFLAD